jgi:phosphoglycolate phosphatase-like HAD superfamily hydrolase
MINFSRYNCILWDFDGVLMDSMAIREQGFQTVLSGYPPEEVMLLLEYHRKNGGLSRYVKFRYFFEVIRKETVLEPRILELAGVFSKVMMESLINPALLINDSLSFVRQYYQQIPMHIVSGSDGEELNEICRQMQISSYFKTIAGSPTMKKDLIADILGLYGYKSVILIGDSLNDFEAAQSNNIDFVGFNNTALRDLGLPYIENFKSISFQSVESQ